jgi:hypothetical protein
MRRGDAVTPAVRTSFLPAVALRQTDDDVAVALAGAAQRLELRQPQDRARHATAIIDDQFVAVGAGHAHAAIRAPSGSIATVPSGRVAAMASKAKAKVAMRIMGRILSPKSGRRAPGLLFVEPSAAKGAG